MKPGPIPDLELRLQREQVICKMRLQGCTYAEIGKRLGLTRQAVNLIAVSMKKPLPSPIHKCSECGAVAGPKRHGTIPKGVLCMGCLTSKPITTFGQRLLTFRVAAGLSLKELSRRSGISFGVLSDHERRVHHPTWGLVLKLTSIFGVRLLDVHNELARKNQPSCWDHAARTLE